MNSNPDGFNPNDGILYTRSAEISSLEAMLQGLNAIASNKILPRNLRILEDGTGARVNFPATDIPVLVSGLEQVLVEYQSIRHAVVHNDPKNTAYAILVDHLMKNEKYDLKVFSTFEAARKWVML
jgi:hypothetical protein